jgi:hypothetical protein
MTDTEIIDWLQAKDGRFHNIDKIAAIADEGFIVGSPKHQVKCKNLREAVRAAAKLTAEGAYTAEQPKCCVCGTTENLHKDGWYGYRCDSQDCMVF